VSVFKFDEIALDHHITDSLFVASSYCLEHCWRSLIIYTMALNAAFKQ